MSFRIVQPCGPSTRDDGGPFYAKKFLGMIPGVTCDRKTMLEPEPTWGEYDATIYVDWGQDYFQHLPEFTPNPDKPSLCWQSDTHMGPTSMQYRFDQAMRYQQAAFYMEGAQRMFATGPNHIPSRWIPCAADHTIYTPPLKDYFVNLDTLPPDPAAFAPYICDIIPRYDLCFVGHVGDAGRDRMLDRLFKAVPSFTFRSGLFFRAAARIFHQSRIVFNYSIRGELNMRTFEALASRSFLLVNRQESMNTLGLTDGVHAAIYDSLDEAVDKARWYLDPKRDALRRHIAQQGWEWFLKGNSYWHRARTLLELVGHKG